MKIAVVYSLPSRRMQKTTFALADEDTAEIAKMVAKGLVARGHQVTTYPVAEGQIESIGLIKADCIFNLIEWCGLDMPLASRAFAMMRSLNVPVTGSSEKLFNLTGDKIAMKKRLREHGIPTPEAIFFERGDEIIPPSFPYPGIVKPALEHCSMGLTPEMVVHNPEELRRQVERQKNSFKQPVLVEEFIRGRELLVYLLECEGEVRVLPIVELFFAEEDGSGFQTYDAKWNPGSVAYQKTTYDMAQLESQLLAKIVEICKIGFLQLGLWGYARFDLRLRDNKDVYILETNANPSVYDAETEIENMEEEVITGIAFADYLDMIVKSAIWHYKRGEQV